MIFEPDCLDSCKHTSVFSLRCLQDMGEPYKRKQERIETGSQSFAINIWVYQASAHYQHYYDAPCPFDASTVQPSCYSIASCPLCRAYLWMTAHKSQEKLGRVTCLRVAILEALVQVTNFYIEEHLSHHITLPV